MQVLEGHLTQTDKHYIRQILNANMKCGSSKRKIFQLSKDGEIYTVKMFVNDRGLIPCGGSELRKSTYIAKFKI